MGGLRLKKRDAGWAVGSLDQEEGSLVSKHRLGSPPSLPSCVTFPCGPYCPICPPSGVILPVKEA